MVRSLLADAEQSGCLPRWPYANGQSMTMVGDSADPILASAAAFGAGAFDRAGGAGGDGQGRDPALPQRQRRIPRAPGPGRATWRSATSPSTSTPTSATPTRSTATRTRSGARRRRRSSTRSTTSRSPSSPPARCGDRATYRAFMRRSANWRRLFNPASGMIEPRFADGRFPAPYDNLGGGGFVEGNSAQYTWMVPAGPGRPDRADGRPGQGGGAARPLPARAQRRRRGGPTPTTPCSATSRPCRRPGSTTGCAGPTAPRRRSAAPCSASTTPRPTATPATTTSARSRPGTCSAPSASTRRCREWGCWRSAARSSSGRKSACRTAAGR